MYFRNMRHLARCSPTVRDYSDVARIWCEGEAQNYVKIICLIIRNNTMNKVRVAATELQQLLLRNITTPCLKKRPTFDSL